MRTKSTYTVGGAPAQSDALLRAIVDSSDDAIVSKDLDGIVSSWNKAAERIFGYSAAEAVGRPVTLIIPPERIDEETTILEKIRAGERVDHFETERVRKDGTRVNVSLTISPVKDASGNVVGASKIARDITERRREEAAHRRTERLLEDFFENGAVGLHWVGPDGRIIRANRAELELLGYSKEEYIGRHIADFHLDAPVIEDILDRLLRGKRIDGREARLRCKDGSIRHVLITSSGYWEGGEFVHSRCFTRDITPRKKAEEKARATIRELNDLKTALDEHAIVAVTDPRGRITYVNDKFCAISKYPREELLGRDHRIINSEYHSKEFIHNLWTTIRSGRVWKGEIKNRAKDGTYYWVDTTIVPYLDDTGKPTQFIAIRADITARKLAEEKLRESEERFRTMADAAPVLIWVSDTDKKANYFNKAWLDFVGRAVEQDLGHGWAENVYPEDRAQCLDIYTTAFDARQPFEVQCRLRHHSGGYRWIVGRGVPRFGPDGTFQGYIGGCVEIETQKRAEEELEQQVAERTAHLKESVESLEGLCYTIAHDLRAPLRAIHGYTGILTEDYAPTLDSQGQQLAQKILHSAARMDNLINDLLEYAKLSHVELVWERLELDKVVHDVLGAMTHEIQAKEAKVTVHPLPAVLGHCVLVEQIFANLLGNALKFVAAGDVPEIEIGADKQSDGTKIWIRDNGIGISPEHRETVFDVFQRLHRNEKTYPGTGVGLAVVKKGMERMGGNVYIAPQRSSGTCFYLEFQSPDRL